MHFSYEHLHLFVTISSKKMGCSQKREILYLLYFKSSINRENEWFMQCTLNCGAKVCGQGCETLCLCPHTYLYVGLSFFT